MFFFPDSFQVKIDLHKPNISNFYWSTINKQVKYTYVNNKSSNNSNSSSSNYNNIIAVNNDNFYASQLPFNGLEWILGSNRFQINI